MPNRALLLEDFFILYEGGELALRGTERSLSQGGEGVWGGQEMERATAQLLGALSQSPGLESMEDEIGSQRVNLDHIPARLST